MMWDGGAARKDILPTVTMSRILQLPFVRLTVTRKQIGNFNHSAFLAKRHQLVCSIIKQKRP